MKYLLIILFLSNFILGIEAQPSTLFFANAKTYPVDRYDDYSGSPYFFEEWVFSELYSQSGDVYSGMVANYNIDDKVFEIRRGKEYVVLDPYMYWCVKMYKSENGIFMKDYQDSMLFVRGLMPDDEKKFVNIIYNGRHIKLLRDMYVAKSAKNFNTIGEGESRKRFSRRDTYHLILDGDYKKVNLNKKDFIKVLGYKEELEQWLKENNNKLKKDQEISDFLLHVETTYYNY